MLLKQSRYKFSHGNSRKSQNVKESKKSKRERREKEREGESERCEGTLFLRREEKEISKTDARFWYTVGSLQSQNVRERREGGGERER